MRASLLSLVSVLLVSFAFPAWADGKEELLQLERDWAKAWVAGDAAFIAKVEADEMVFTSEDGTVRLQGKAGDLAGLKDGTNKFEAFAADDMHAMVFGDAGVVVGRVTMKGMYMGQPVDQVVRFTDVFVKRDGRWQCVATQSTRVPKS